VTLVLAVCGLLGGTRAHAQTTQPAEGDPIIVGEREAWDAWELDSLGAAVETQVRSRRFSRSTVGQADQTDTETYLLGRMELSGRAFVGHKNLLDITGRVGIGYEQTDINSDIVGTSESDTDLNLLYDISALILAEGPVPTTAYSRRDERQLDREFAGSITSTNTEHGVMGRVASEVLPTTFHIFRRETEQTDQFGDVDYGVEQNTISLRTRPALGEHQDLSVEYTLDMVDERQSRFFENSYTRHDLQAIHELRFGDEQRHNLRSTARYFDESGIADTRRYRLDEVLRLEHTRRFDTRYELTAEDTTIADQTQRYFKAAGQARYRLFDSLIAVGGVGADRLEATGGFTSDQLFANADLQYIKSVPLGRLDAAVGGRVNRQENSEQGEPVTVTDQSLTLSETLPTILNRRNIVAGSVLVSNADGTRVYAEGLDYTIVFFPSHVEIRRVVGGDIAEGESLLVDFTVGPEPASTIDSTSVSFAARYTLEEGTLRGVSGYINYTQLDQEIDTADPTRFVLDDVQELRYGLDYHRGNITLEAERRNHDSTISPFDTTRLEARYDLRVGTGAVTASVSNEVTDFPASGEQVEFTRATVRAYGRIGPGLDLTARIIYRDEQSRLSPDLVGFEQSVEVVWRKGRTTISASVFNAMLDSGTSDSTSQTLSLGVRRTF
jgi:hypothetical protein